MQEKEDRFSINNNNNNRVVVWQLTRDRQGLGGKGSQHVRPRNNEEEEAGEKRNKKGLQVPSP